MLDDSHQLRKKDKKQIAINREPKSMTKWRKKERKRVVKVKTTHDDCEDVNDREDDGLVYGL